MAFISESPYQRSVVLDLSPCASPASLLILHQPYDYVDGATDQHDISIATELLVAERPRIPPRRSSFGHSSPSLHQPLLDGEQHRISAQKEKDRRSRLNTSSNTWTSSSGDGSDGDDVEDRSVFIQEYNRLAKKYGVHSIVPDEFEAVYVDKVTIVAKQGSWILRKLLRRTSSVQPATGKQDKKIKHRRSISDITGRIRAKKDRLKDKHLAELVRLCGASPLYLPSEYAAGTLSVPTCFRATAQYLVQHATATRGIFRIPGSHSSVNSLYNHYASQDEGGEIISGTVRCPNLPNHINCDVHDVASAFKKFLSGLPGGILGKPWLLDALISIQNHLDSDPEWTRTKQSKVRARLIALAIGCHTSRFQRELICAVFGLLCMVGRAAETAQREDSHGRPLPTSDLMGYGSLGIVFGPLLIGELMNEYKMPAKELIHDLVNTPPSPPKSSKGRHKKSKTSGDSLLASKFAAEKAAVANEVAEMLIMHWREVVRHMKNLGALKSTKDHQNQSLMSTKPLLRPSASETFFLHRPPQWDTEKSSVRRVDRSRSPTPNQRDFQRGLSSQRSNLDAEREAEHLSVAKTRARIRPMSGHQLSGAKSMSVLSPTVEEPQGDPQYNRLASHRTDAHILHGSRQYHPSIKPSTSNSKLRLLSLESIKPGVRPALTESYPTPPPPQRQDFRYRSSSPESLNAAALRKQSAISNFSSHGGRTSERSTPLIKNAQIQEGKDSELRKSNGKLATPILGLNQVKHGLTEPDTVQMPGYSPCKGPESNRSYRIPSHVPEGIVSQRLKDLAATGTATAPPSDLQPSLEILNHPDIGHKVSQDSYDTIGDSQNSLRLSKDQVRRISDGEDKASLAALTAVIQSQEECLPSYMAEITSKLKDIELEDSETSHSLQKLIQTISERTPSSHEVERGEIELGKITDKSIAGTPKNPRTVALAGSFATPSRRTTDHALANRGRIGSVKAMAARFDSADRGSGPQLSPTRSLEIRRSNRNINFDSPVVSSYTTNLSPAPKSHRSTRSDKSLKTVSNSLDSDPLLESRPATTPTKSFHLPDSEDLSTGQSVMTSSTFPLPKLRRVNEKSQDEAPPRAKSNAAPFQVRSSLIRTGDGNASFSLIQQPSLGTLLPRPDEPPVAQHLTFSRPSSTPGYSDSANPSSPSNCGKTSLEIDNSVLSGVSATPNNDQRRIVRGSSVLYAQIQNMQRQLQLKTEEIDQLRRQLLAKGSLNDLGTLSEELRQVKRDSKMWQTRAELAEKRIELIRQLEPQVNLTTEDGQPRESFKRTFSSPQSSNAERCKNNVYFAERIRKVLYGLDGAASGADSPQSDGTVRRQSVSMICYPNGI